VEIDGQKYDYPANGASSAAMTWPGPEPGHVVIRAFDGSSHPVGAPLRFDGDWAFFHSLDAGHLQKQGDLGYLASFDFDGHTVKLPMQAASLKNPFLNDEVRRFRCPR
jgi:type VI secretion system protein ImpL